MSKTRRRTAEQRLTARLDRADIAYIRGALVRAAQAHQERERTGFWLRLGAPDPPTISPR